MPRDIATLVSQLTLDEKTALMAGLDLWSTTPVERLGIPPVWVTDGPNGARGPALPGARTDDSPTSAACMPCGTALGSTWDPALVERVGAAIADEARTKACRVLLAPTVNLHRSPLGGRNFESYSEDPLLAGRIAAAFVRGAQSRGVATTVKHFAGNESEHERMSADSRIDERTLHELYLLPFELAVREGGALGIMTSYNLVNGEYLADSRRLLHDVLREQWGFDGFVLTDWFARSDTVAAAHAGLDLEMPGPGRSFGPPLAAAVRGGQVDESMVDDAVVRLLTVFDRVGALDDPVARTLRSVDLPEHRTLAYEAACAGTVLLQNAVPSNAVSSNKVPILPLTRGAIRSLAVVGPNAGRARIMGGGSSQFTPHYLVSPLDALRTKLEPDTTIVHEPGVDIARHADPLPAGWCTRADGTAGVDLAIFPDDSFDGAPIARQSRNDTALWFFGPPSPLVSGSFAARATCTVRAPADLTMTLSLVQAGHAQVYLDEHLVLDGVVDPMPRGRELYGSASEERTTEVALEAGRAYALRIDYHNVEARMLGGCKLGARAATPGDLFARAVHAAGQADAVVVVVGTDDDWETEGHDRDAMRLPGRQDELVAAVLAANPNTVVVLNCGSPNELPWIDDAGAVLQVWFGGQEMAAALADMIFGDAEPGGRLPVTFPRRLEQNPSYGNFPAENGTVRYGERLLMGYRWYDTKHIETRFAFGHGLGYTTMVFDAPSLSSDVFVVGHTLTIDVAITNTGARRGSEVVQCYVVPLEPRVMRPVAELKAFAKVVLDPGAREVARLVLHDRSFAYWQPADPAAAARAARVVADVPFTPAPAPVSTVARWQVDPGRYELRIGRSSRDISHRCVIDVASS